MQAPLNFANFYLFCGLFKNAGNNMKFFRAVFVAMTAFMSAVGPVQAQDPTIDMIDFARTLNALGPLTTTNELAWSSEDAEAFQALRAKLNEALLADPNHQVAQGWFSGNLQNSSGVNIAWKGFNPHTYVHITDASPLDMDQALFFIFALADGYQHQEDGSCLGVRALSALASKPKTLEDVAFLNAVRVSSTAAWHTERGNSLPRAVLLAGSELPKLEETDQDKKWTGEQDQLKGQILDYVIENERELTPAGIADGFFFNVHDGSPFKDEAIARAIADLIEAGLAEPINLARPFYRQTNLLSGRPYKERLDHLCHR
ncbi:hypothetical protein [Sulfitobacter sp. 20_GPM-1509m]|uniref:hypothetical protein n=1 Tax=Sulfitobacter sp. 20_GPM-1509m TaxID=1380367 RepID=UPI001C30948B|nr:hypothetical protein [Sulfitobacter sp. 20_GPM-1509m]